jgi:hypothetical protein
MEKRESSFKSVTLVLDLADTLALLRAAYGDVPENAELQFVVNARTGTPETIMVSWTERS